MKKKDKQERLIRDGTKDKVSWEWPLEDIGIEYLAPWDFYIDPECNAFAPRWWHKFIFWKKWKYPECRIKIITQEEFRKKFKDEKKRMKKKIKRKPDFHVFDSDRSIEMKGFCDSKKLFYSIDGHWKKEYCHEQDDPVTGVISLGHGVFLSTSKRDVYIFRIACELHQVMGIKYTKQAFLEYVHHT
jgi:hypothetical protein